MTDHPIEPNVTFANLKKHERIGIQEAALNTIRFHG